MMFLRNQNLRRPATHPHQRNPNPQCRALISPFLVMALSVQAAYPLVVDDAKTVEPGGVELVTAAEHVRYENQWTLALPVEAAFGLTPRLDAAIEFGYQLARLEEDGERRQVDGFLDTVLTLKGRWLEQERHHVSVSLGAGVKLPTASDRKGLGSGDIDAEMLLMATRSWGQTALDANVGYIFSRPFAVRRESDLVFYGLAGRHLLSKSLELFGEVFAESPHDDWDESQVVVRAGFQLVWNESVLWGAGLGTGLRGNGPDLTTTTGVTWLF